MKIEFHADDYGLFPEQSRLILKTFEEGALNGISIMPNSPFLKECMDWVMPYVKQGKMAITVHLNLMEGRALSDPSMVPHLTDRNGVFHTGFGKYLAVSYIPGLCKVYKRELKRELRRQIENCLPYFPDGKIRLDGHGHYHMLPVVYDAIAELIKEEGWNVTFIRFPSEHVPLYQKHKSEIHDNKPINYVKVAILNYLTGRNAKKHPKMYRSLEPYDFMGVMLSGHMCTDNVKPLYKDAVKLAEERGNNLEILFHPGGVYNKEDENRLTNADDVSFLTSDWRNKEAQALIYFKNNA